MNYQTCLGSQSRPHSADVGKPIFGVISNQTSASMPRQSRSVTVPALPTSKMIWFTRASGATFFFEVLLDVHTCRGAWGFWIHVLSVRWRLMVREVCTRQIKTVNFRFHFMRAPSIGAKEKMKTLGRVPLARGIQKPELGLTYTEHSCFFCSGQSEN